MRIVAGRFKGKSLLAPPGEATRPTADRARQALFDIIMHAPWGGHDLIAGATILDVFAGTGALGLEALSRGAGLAHFIENDPPALKALRANLAACKGAEGKIHAADALNPSPGASCALVLLDPPYRKSLITMAVPRLADAGWIAPGSVIVAETARDEDPPLPASYLTERTHGAAKFWIWRH